MNRSMLAGTCLFLGLVLGQVNAQDSVLAELYGQGVHAYFSRNLQLAHEMFTSAIEQGSQDPRCYYYRGLTYAQLGRPDEAEADFKAGALVEVGSADRIYPVADSLQRVQGRMRLQIERHRQVARLTSHSKASQIQRARYEQLKRSEQDVVRDPNRQPAAAAPDATVPAPPAEKTDPFAGNIEPMPEKAPEKPAQPAVEPAAPAVADPFVEAPKTAPAAPATTPAPDDSKTDPFADDKPATDTKPAAPTAEKPAAPSDDPFK